MFVKNVFIRKISIDVLLLISLGVYLFAPKDYSQPFITFCFLIFILTYLLFFKIKNDKNFFCFDFIFTIVFTFVYFMYPLFVFPINKTRFFMFNNGFNEDVINKATALALIGYQFFVLGFLSYRQSRNRKNKNFSSSIISNTIPTYLLFLLVIFHFIQIYVFKAGVLYGEAGNANPNDSGGIWGYISIIRNGFIIASISIEFYNLFHQGKIGKWYKQNLLLWCVLFLEVICTVSTGSRGGALQIALMLFAGYAILKKGISFKQILLLMLIGFIALSFIVVARSGGAFVFSFNILDMAMDLIINNYTLYVGYEYVQENGSVIFTLIGSLLSAIPLLQGIVVNTFNIPIDNTSSARFFSTLVLGDNPEFGVGTNIIGALYLSGGFFMVIFLMYLLGKFIAYISCDLKNSSIYKVILFFSMMGNSVYIVRADYFYPVGKIVFSVLFVLIFTFPYFFKCTYIKENNCVNNNELEVLDGYCL